MQEPVSPLRCATAKATDFSRIAQRYITVRRIRICPIYHIMILSGMFMVVLGSVPAENRSLQPLLGQKSISLKSRTEGAICLRRLQQWVITWQRSRRCTRIPIKSLYWLLEPRTTGEYFTDSHFDFKKCFKIWSLAVLTTPSMLSLR